MPVRVEVPDLLYPCMGGSGWVEIGYLYCTCLVVSPTFWQVGWHSPYRYKCHVISMNRKGWFRHSDPDCNWRCNDFVVLYLCNLWTGRDSWHCVIIQYQKHFFWMPDGAFYSWKGSIYGIWYSYPLLPPCSDPSLKDRPEASSKSDHSKGMSMPNHHVPIGSMHCLFSSSYAWWEP